MPSKKGLAFIALIISIWLTFTMPVWLTPPYHMATPFLYSGVSLVLLLCYLFTKPRQAFTRPGVVLGWKLLHVFGISAFALLLLGRLGLFVVYGNVSPESPPCEQQIEANAVHYICAIFHMNYKDIHYTFETSAGLPVMRVTDTEWSERPV